MNFDRLREAERSEVGEAREAVLAVTILEKRGSFRRFCAVLDGHSVTKFNYRIADTGDAHLTDDDLAKQHVRRMVGGRPARAN